ncbi:hypothetical protein SAMN05421505_1648 [Sinosporangium album]|uniref:Uncharacterized protein n=1 Tax=Sinosporangium album TaxID=504805 RepID=A0A1G8LC49_9ACTN|nr:hypothetical protein SAMN05421505_1648 [Sinosporangium album]
MHGLPGETERKNGWTLAEAADDADPERVQLSHLTRLERETPSGSGSVFGSSGWFKKHGKMANVTVPRDVYNNLKGLVVGEMCASVHLGPKGIENIKGDNWMRPRITGGC